MTRTTIRLLLVSVVAATWAVCGTAQEEPPATRIEPAAAAEVHPPVSNTSEPASDEKSRPVPPATNAAPIGVSGSVRPTQSERQPSSEPPQALENSQAGNSPATPPGVTNESRRSPTLPHPAHGSSLGRNYSRRSQLGISIGPGGVQIFRGDPRLGPGPQYARPNYYGRDSWRYGARGRTSFQWYPNRGWGLSIDTRPTVVVPSDPVVITQPQGLPAPAEIPVPTEDELAGMPGIELRGLLLYSVDHLHEELGLLSTGAGWQSYLRTAELKRLIPSPALAPAPPDATSPQTTPEPLISESHRRRLEEILRAYDDVQRKTEYGRITQLWGFATTRRALRELLVPPVQRLRNQLSLSVELLGEELEQFESGSTWKDFLKLADLERLAVVRPQELSEGDRKQLHVIASLLDSTAAEPRYRMISELLGFRLTLHLTRSYLAQLVVPQPPSARPVK